jgi:tetratricopeptide (TPR) repeat protein
MIEIVMRTRADGGTREAPNTGTTFVQEVPERAKKAYERGVSLLDAKDSDGGIAALVEAIEIFPDYYLALERIGAEFVQRKDFDRASIALTRAISINPSGHLSLYALGVTQYNQKKYSDAAEQLRRSYLLAPGSTNAPFVQFYLGLSLIKLDRPADAEAQLRRAYELGGKRIPPDVHLHLAQIYSDSKRYREAADELELFLKEAPTARDAESIRNVIKQLRAKAGT